jgi:glycosyltransferase involved in cell wall biosynthesis
MLVGAAAGVVGRVRLVIVGEGSERQAIADVAEGMMFDDQLVMPGFLAEPHRYMGLFDIFALSSLSEQAPISLIEAMAAGLPAVSTPVGDVAQMVAPENVPYLCPTFSGVQYRDHLQALVKHPEARAAVGKANQARARALFDEGEMIAAYARLYGEALGRPGIFA